MKKDEYQFGVSDYLQLSIWYVVLGLFIYWKGLLFGFFMYILLNYVVAWVFKMTMKLEMMTGGDEIWFLDDARNSTNIVAFHRYEKFADVDVFRQTLMQRMKPFPRLHSKITKVFGKFMFNQLPYQDVADKIDDLMPVIDGIHDEKTLAEYMALQQSTRLPLNSMQWRIFFVPDYNETESLFVYKVHHSLADGIANILFFNDMTDDPKLEGYPSLMVRFNFIQDIAIKMVMPLYLLWLGFKLVIVMGKERNGFKNPSTTSKLTALKNVTLIPDLNIEDVKKRASELSTDVTRFTINDVLTTILSKTLHDYLRLNTDDKDIEWLKMACPFSLRPPPRKLGDFSFDNSFAIVNFAFRLVDSLQGGIKLINQDMQRLKKSIEPIGLYYLIKILMQLPHFIRNPILEDYTDKMTFGFSNVPGPKLPYVVAGAKNRGMGFIMPVGRSMVGSFSFISHAEVIKIVIALDKAVMEDPDVLKDLFLANMDEMLGPAWRDFHKDRNGQSVKYSVLV